MQQSSQLKTIGVFTCKYLMELGIFHLYLSDFPVAANM